MSILNADRWLFKSLTENSDLQALIGSRVFVDVAPEGTEYPFVVFQFVHSAPVDNNSVERIMNDELWLVRSVGMGNSYTGLEPIANLIENILHKATGDGVIGAVQEEEFRYSEFENGVHYKHIGHYYRIFTQ